MKGTVKELKEALNEQLSGENCCDMITKSEYRAVMSDFNRWSKTAKNGDMYHYGGHSYEITKRRKNG